MSFNLKFEMDDDSRKKRLSAVRGYIDADIPILKDWDLYENDTIKKDITPEEIRKFIDWLSDGPIYPVPSMAKKILCIRRTKLKSTIDSWSVTAGQRQQAQRLLDSIDEILKEGDDTFDPASVCSNTAAEAVADAVPIATPPGPDAPPTGPVPVTPPGVPGCGDAQAIQIPDDCCNEMRKELGKVKDMIIEKIKNVSETVSRSSMSIEDRAEEARRKAAQAIAEAEAAHEKLKKVQNKKNVSAVELETAIQAAEASRLKAERLIKESDRLFGLSEYKKFVKTDSTMNQQRQEQEQEQEQCSEESCGNKESTINDPASLNHNMVTNKSNATNPEALDTNIVSDSECCDIQESANYNDPTGLKNSLVLNKGNTPNPEENVLENSECCEEDSTKLIDYENAEPSNFNLEVIDSYVNPRVNMDSSVKIPEAKDGAVNHNDEVLAIENNEFSAIEDKKTNQKGGEFTAQNGIRRKHAYDSIEQLAQTTAAAKERLRNLGYNQQLPQGNHERIGVLEQKLKELESHIPSDSPIAALNQASDLNKLQTEVQLKEQQINELEKKLSQDSADKKACLEQVQTLQQSLKNLTEAAASVFPIVEGYVDGSRQAIAKMAELKEEMLVKIADLNGNLAEGINLYKKVNLLVEELNTKIEKGLDTTKVKTQIQNNQTQLDSLVSSSSSRSSSNHSEGSANTVELDEANSKFENANKELLVLHDKVEATPSLAVQLAIKTNEYENLIKDKEALQKLLHNAPESTHEEEVEKYKNNINSLTDDKNIRVRLEAAISQLIALEREQELNKQRILSLQLEDDQLQAKIAFLEDIKPSNNSAAHNKLKELQNQAANHETKLNEAKATEETLNNNTSQVRSVMNNLVNQTTKNYPKVNTTRKSNNNNLIIRKLNNTQKVGGKRSLKSKSKKIIIKKKVGSLKKGARLVKLYREIPPLY